MSSFELLTSVCLLVVCSFVSGQRWGAIRLKGGADDSEGRLEVFTKNEWGTVCHDYFGQEDAKVVCRQLGYTDLEESKKYTWAHFGQGTGPIFLDNLHCSGLERNLFDCNHNGIGIHNCYHSKDVGVACFCLVTPPCPRPAESCPYLRTEIVTIKQNPILKLAGIRNKQPCPFCRCALCPERPVCPHFCKSGKTMYYQGKTCRRCKCRPEELPDVIHEPNEIPLAMMLAVVVIMFVIPVISLIVVCILNRRQEKQFKAKAKAAKDRQPQQPQHGQHGQHGQQQRSDWFPDAV